MLGTVLSSLMSDYSRPHITAAIVEDCYVFAVLFFYFPSQIFRRPGLIFAKLCHTTRYVLKYFMSYMGVHMCPLKIWRGKKCFADLRTQSRYFQRHHSIM